MIDALALMAFDGLVAVVLTADFTLWRRRAVSLAPTLPGGALLVALIVVAARAETPVSVLASGAVVLLGAVFAYANFLAFVKRGVTFSILRNHALPMPQRRPDDDFIAIEQRLEEMRGHGWIAQGTDGWALTQRGRHVLGLRRLILRLLRTETVG